MGTLSLRFVLAELGGRLEVIGFGELSCSEYQIAQKHSQLNRKSLPCTLVRIAFLGPANQERCITVTHYYHSARCPVIIPSHLLPCSTFLTTLPLPEAVPGLKAC